MTDATVAKPLWRRLIGFNLLAGIALGIVGFYFGWWLGHQIHAESLDFFADTNQNDVALMLGYLFAVVGFLAGLGFLNYPISRMFGAPVSLAEKEEGGVGRYFTSCTDHKVVGIQYLIGIGLFFFIAGMNAMLIRTELLRPSPQLFGAGNYLTLVGLHGTMMMGIMTSGVLGPFANYFIPLMIGSRRMAYPRIESLTFWLLMAAGTILMTTLLFGGFPTGWTGYAPLGDQANYGFDSYIFFFALVGISMTLFGLNMITTIITMRAPGLTWSRLPMLCWGAISTGVLMVLAAPVLIAVLLMVAFDRGVQTSFFLSSAGGSPYLFQNLFWFFGHPEVYVLALPGMGILLEIIPVFARKRLWGYRIAVSGLLGITLLSFFVWQHHLFVSGLNSSLRPFYMFSTEAISIPTGLVFLAGMGTLWRAKIRYTVPMLFCLAWFFNFFVGGASGVFLSDVPSDVATHGSFFVMAHFHYTIMGGLVFVFFGAIYYWVPKMFGIALNERLGKIHFWTMFIAFNSTFFPLFALGLMGQPRRVVTYPSHLQALNDWVSVSAFVLGASMLLFLYNVVYSLVIVRKPAPDNPWESKSLEWQTPTPVPVEDYPRPPVIDSDPYDYGVPPVPQPASAEAPAPG
ncbi:MAG: cytochrome c oxidase subunit I [Solirubrobacterales bacterium]